MNPIIFISCLSLAAVDGDTVKCDGQNLRPMGDGAPFISGFDTPEVGRYADCMAERRLGGIAKARMAELLETPGLVIEDSGEKDVYDRPLVVLRMPSGATVGQTLIDEGLAVEWTPDYRDSWCSK